MSRLRAFVTGAITREQAMESLQVGRSRLYDLRTSYLAARAAGRGDEWSPGVSCGNHMPAWPDKVQSFLKKALAPVGDARRLYEREGLSAATPLDDVNDHLACLIDHRNGFETHRDLGDVPLAAWDRAVAEGRCKIRQPPREGWWEMLWSEWKGVVIGPRGRLVVGDTLCTTECANGTRAWRCLHLDGTVSLVLNKPERGVRPKVVFSNNPKVRSFEERIVPDLAPRNAKR